jgi:hypothetical protein
VPYNEKSFLTEEGFKKCHRWQEIFFLFSFFPGNMGFFETSKKL